MQIIGFAIAVFIGVSLGLMGGGGSILAVPVLVYLMDVEPVLATAYSLFIVGSAALIGAIKKFKKGLVRIKAAITLAMPSFLTVYLMRVYLVPAIPEKFNIGSFLFTKNNSIMIVLVIILAIVAVLMIKSAQKGENHKTSDLKRFNYPTIMVEGAAIGVLAGAIGAGGGFLIIPALVLHVKLHIKTAVGTSLLIIAINSLLGFAGDLQSGQPIDWPFLLYFTSFVVVGIFIGDYFSDRISGKKLKGGLGWLIIIVAACITLKEFIIN